MPLSNARGLFGTAAIAILATLTGCSTGSVEQLPCPRYGALDTADSETKFRPGPGRDLTDVMYQVRLAQVQRVCQYDRGGVTAMIHAGFALELGPANPDRNATFDYFVAITDPNNTVLAKEVFPVKLAFPSNIGYVEHLEEVEQRIPLPRGVSAGDYQIVVGLQLSRDELEYNRRTQTRR